MTGFCMRLRQGRGCPRAQRFRAGGGRAGGQLCAGRGVGGACLSQARPPCGAAPSGRQTCSPGLFNLLPVPPLDGAQMADACAAQLAGKNTESAHNPPETIAKTGTFGVK